MRDVPLISYRTHPVYGNLFIEIYESLLVCVRSAASVHQQMCEETQLQPLNSCTRCFGCGYAAYQSRRMYQNKSGASCTQGYFKNPHMTNARAHSNRAIKHKGADEASALSSCKERRRSGGSAAVPARGAQSIAGRHAGWHHI